MLSDFYQHHNNCNNANNDAIKQYLMTIAWRSNLSEEMVCDRPVCLHVYPSTDSRSWKSSGFLHHDVDQTLADWTTEADALQPGSNSINLYDNDKSGCDTG